MKTLARPHRAVLLTALCIVACSSTPKRNPVPANLVQVAALAETEDARYFVDSPPEFWVGLMKKYAARTKAGDNEKFSKQEHHYLAISGGGANGAYGAGLLCGWSELGTRPEFTIVTGVSTGALTAPFAFLGTKYDPVIREMYTKFSTKDLVEQRSIFRILFSDAAADVDGIKAKLRGYMTPAVIQEIAAEHKQGRRLFVGTTNLDAQRAMIWNIGAIASSPREDKRDLLCDIILASASIPGAFPPVIVQVVADGKPYDEMHVDGGTSEQVFLYPPSTNWRKALEIFGVPGQPTAYVLRNSRFRPSYAAVERKIIPIAASSIDSLLRNQGIGDIYRIYNECQRDGVGFNVTAIPNDFDLEPKEPFDRDYMNKLFEVGRKTILEGKAWSNVPPHYTASK